MRPVAFVFGIAHVAFLSVPLANAATGVSTGPDDTPGRVLLAQVDNPQASAQQLFAQAYSAKEAGDLETSERLFQQGLALDPDNALGRRFLLEVREARENARKLFAQGYDAKQAGDYQTAVRLFDAGLKIEPGNFSAQKLLAETRSQLATAAPAPGANGDPVRAIRQALESRYRLSRANADETDIEAVGAAVSLQRGRLVMSPVFLKGKKNRLRASNVYEDGSIRPQGVLSALSTISAEFGSILNGGNTTSGGRIFESGETMLITRIEVRDNEVVFNLMSNVINGDRFSGSLKFKFAGRDASAPDQAASLVGQVLRPE